MTNNLVHPKNIADTKRAAEFCNIAEDELMWFSENYVECPKPIAEIGSGYLWDLAELTDFAVNLGVWKKVKVNFPYFVELLKKTSSTLPQDATNGDAGYTYTESELEVLRKASSDQSDEVAENGVNSEAFPIDMRLLDVLFRILDSGRDNPTLIQWVYQGDPFVSSSLGWSVHLRTTVEMTEAEFHILQDFYEKRKNG